MSNHFQLKLGAEFQPLVCPQSLTVFGYEALSRFYTPQGSTIAPNIIFEQLHKKQDWLAKVELEAKRLQIQHAPVDYALYVNIDPHAVETHNKEMLTLLKSRSKLCVEIIENTCINDAKLSGKLIQQLLKEHIDVALDDVGAPHSLVSIELISAVSCIKFDKHWLTMADQPEYQHLLAALINFAKQTRKVTILEGIETEKQLAFATQIGVDFVQGFLFKSQFLQAKTCTTIANILQPI